MKVFLKISVCSLIVYVCLSMIGAYSLWWRAVIESIAFPALTIWMVKKHPLQKRSLVYAAVFVGMAFFELPMRILYSSMLFTMMHSLCVVWAFVTTILFYEFRSKIFLVLASLIWVFAVTEGIDRWKEYITHGNLSQEQTLNVADLYLEKEDGEFKLQDLEGEYVLLYFWGSHCPACFKSFPSLQTLSEEYGNDSILQIASVFLKDTKRNETLETGKDIASEKGYNFTVFASEPKRGLAKHANVHAVPTVLILNKSRDVIFRGSLKFAKRRIKETISEYKYNQMK